MIEFKSYRSSYTTKVESKPRAKAEAAYGALRLEVLALYDGKRTASDIARILDKRKEYVQMTIKRAGLPSVIKPRTKKRDTRLRDTKTELKKANAALAKAFTFDGLPSDIKAWLSSQVPQGGTMQELVEALITDAYFEETSGD